jgi:hypothetical protein
LANWNNVTLGGSSGQTINITGAQGAMSGTGYSSPWAIQGLNTSISLSDLDWSAEPHVKKYQVLEIEEDLLALSCAWHRIRTHRRTDPDGPYLPISSLTSSVLFGQVTQADHDKAAQVRDYYSKKVMLWKLTDRKLSKFREDMNTFIHTDGKIFREDMQPLAYRLPEFYDYDIDFDMLINEHNKKLAQKSQSVSGSKRLKLAKTFVVGAKHSKRKEYWFSDENNDLVSMSLTLDNPLLSLLDMYAQNPIKVEAIYSKKNRDNNEYLVANKFKFI